MTARTKKDTKKYKRISERGMEARLMSMLERRYTDRGGNVCNFAARGVLTGNRGVVLTLPNGQEFHFIIVEN